MTTASVFSRWVSSPSLCFSICCCAMVLLLSQLHMVAAETAAVPINRLDLSYLHRCGAGDIANAIRGTLEEEQREQQESTPVNGNTGANEQEKGTGASENSASVVDIDLTASLIGKNVSEILSSLTRLQEPPSQEDDGWSASPTIVRLTARRNRLSPMEATALLEFASENGPTNETATVDESENETTTADRSGDEDSLSSTGVAASETSEVADSDGKNLTTEIVTTTITSATTSENNADVIDASNHEDDVGTEIRAAAEPAETTPVAKTRIRPAFVSIRSLDLGWNNLGTSTIKSSAGVRNVNRAIRRLLADTERCPHTIRLNVCGLGPPACREVAKGIVERYQRDGPPKKVDEKQGGNDLLPPPLSLDLACNEGIGDVGVAALAAAIRTVAPRETVNKEKKKKRRRKKKSKQQPSQEEFGEEGDDEEDNVEQENVDEVEEETAKGSNNTDSESSPEEQTDAPPTIAETRTILKRLDLSGCDIGDVGAEALAIALTNNPLCVKHLDLSNNRISDQGATALARALGARDVDESGTAGVVETLDLSHNKDLGDLGAKELADAFGRNGISKLILRSCNVRADGAACFGTALRSIGSQALRKPPASLSKQQGGRLIDLSGNPLGILSKKKKSGSKYSATALRSKATDTTKAYMNIIGKSLQKGLNSINAMGGEGGMDTLESDDEEEDRMGESEDEDESRKKCGALSLAEAFIRDGVEDTENTGVTNGKDDSVHVELGLRHCSFDTRAAEALAAILQESKQNYPGMKLSMDMKMNHVLEEDIIAALHGEEGYDDQLADMAEVYLDALEIMREARKRALEASRIAAARARAKAEREAAWANPPISSRPGNDYGGKWSDESDDDDDWGDSIANDNKRNFEEDYSEDDW